MTEQGFGTGAHESPHDERDYLWEAIGSAPIPFDWSKGYRVPFSFPIKNQYDSSSCGGQAGSYYEAVLEADATGSFEERSAKFLYAPIAYPIGGSIGRDIMDRMVKAGFGFEALTSSYKPDSTTDEAFMTQTADITDEARRKASLNTARSYTKIVSTLSIDTIAQAVRDNKGAIIGINGADNGTWLSKFPQPPKTTDWRHWLYAMGAEMIDGKKYIVAVNSWGALVGENGYQWLSEDWFTSNNIFEAWTVIYNTDVVTPAFKYYFAYNMKLGDQNDNVKALQQALRNEGLFTYPENTGFYGSMTAKAVYAFQCKYNIAPLTRWYYQGKYCYEATRKVLNDLYAAKSPAP